MTPSIYISQALNRYSYVGNNPLSRTDPTGHSWLSKLFRKVPILRAIFQIALAITLQSFFALPAIGLATDSAANVFLSASISSGISGGSLKAALIGGVQALAFHGVGVFKGLAGIKNGSPGSAVLHGLVGGLASEAQGGKFIQGFLAAGFGDLAGNVPIAKGGGRMTAFRAIVGGATAELGGGKFLNGAVTAAFGYLFNELGSQAEETTDWWENEGFDSLEAAVEAKRGQAVSGLENLIKDADVRSGSREEGAVAILNLKTGEIRYLYGRSAGRAKGDSEFQFKFSRNIDEIVLGTAHSHPRSDPTLIDARKIDKANESLSPGDLALLGIDRDRDPTGVGSVAVLKTPTGELRCFMPSGSEC